MELFLVIAISANVILTAVCAYCLSHAISQNKPEQENRFLIRTSKITRGFVIIGGSLLIAFSLWSALILFGGAYL